MVFNKRNGVYSSIISLGDVTLSIDVDTGAPFSVISREFIKALFNVDKVTLPDVEGTEFKSYGSDVCNVYLPVSFRNIEIADKKFDKLNFYTPRDLNTDRILLGWDFLNACSFSSSVDGDFNVTAFNVDTYNEYWSKVPVKPVEICNLQSWLFYTQEVL